MILRPFSDLKYARALSDQASLKEGSSCAMLLRAIDGTTYLDGHLPWPYVCLDAPEVNALAGLYPELVSITGVVLPPQHADIPDVGAIQPFKAHFVFSPDLPPAPLSKKSLANLEEGRSAWAFTHATLPGDWNSFQELYQELVQRRGLALTSFNFSTLHFEALRALPYVMLFGVRNGENWGAMLCAAHFGAELHLIHIVVSAEGLRSNASYALMQGMIDLCRDQQLALFVGGVPAGDNGGMLKFKKRWTNQTRMSYLVRIIVRPDVYAELAAPGNAFFPAYRKSWSI